MGDGIRFISSFDGLLFSQGENTLQTAKKLHYCCIEKRLMVMVPQLGVFLGGDLLISELKILIRKTDNVPTVVNHDEIERLIKIYSTWLIRHLTCIWKLLDNYDVSELQNLVKVFLDVEQMDYQTLNLENVCLNVVLS